MMEEEFKLNEEQNYEVLAQIYTIINDTRTQKNVAIEKVLKQDFDINYSVPSSKCSLPHIAGHTALDFALDKRELDVFKTLMRHGASEIFMGKSILHEIIKKSYVKKTKCHTLKGKLEHPFVESVLSAHITNKKVTNPHDSNGVSYFHIACMFNHIEAVEFFLAQRVYVNQAINQNSEILPGYTPLHIAARYSAFETTKLLLDHDADVNLKNGEGINPLDLIIQRNIEILDWQNVQKKEICENVRKEFSINEEIIKLLFENVKNNKGLSCCHIACTLQNTQLLEETMAEGVNLNDSFDKSSALWPGYTALHFAAICNINAVKLLLANGANILAEDANGITPWDLCVPRYSPYAIHSVMAMVPNINKITFSNTSTRLSDLILSMSEEDALRTFLKKTTGDINMSLPFDSIVWPGYTILHVAVVLADRIYKNRNLYENSDYNKGEHEYVYCESQQYYKRTQLCLAMGADVTVADFHSSTPLHLAFRHNNTYIAKLLLEHHHKLENVADRGNLSYLHIACAVKCWKTIEKLIRAGADVNSPIRSTFDYQLLDEEDDEEDIPEVLHVNPGWTCLHIAVISCDRDLIEMLMKHGADVYAKDSCGMTPIHLILWSRCLIYDCEILFSKHNEDHVTTFGLTHLHVACFTGDIGHVKKLLNRGADIEAKVNCKKILPSQYIFFFARFHGFTPLRFALLAQNADIVKLLFKLGVDLFSKSADGSIPFYEAFKTSFNIYVDSSDDSDYSDMYESEFDDVNKKCFGMKILSNKKIRNIIEEQSGITKLHIACWEIDEAKVIKLLRNGADPNAQISKNSPIWSGYTPLHILVTPRSADDRNWCRGAHQIVKEIGIQLITFGASVLIKDDEGKTPIHKAAEFLWFDSKLYGEGIFFKSWILEGIQDFNNNPVDAGGISHFHVACMAAEQKVIEQFLTKCSDLDINRHFGHFTDLYGNFTSLHLACFYKDDSIVDLLLKNGANPHAKDFLGNTPFHTAAVYCRLHNNGYRSNNYCTYDRLVEAGADVKEKNLWNETPLAVMFRMDFYQPGDFYEMLKNQACCVNIFNPNNNEGLLGVALRYKSMYPKSVEDEYYYKAIVNALDLNGANEMGCTIIHNVVSVSECITDRWTHGSIEDYTKVIHAFMKLDFDIDCQDDKGETALHKAAHFGNYNAIIGLLDNGADINIVDAKNKPAFAYSIERNEENDDTRRTIVAAYLVHIYKLRIARLEISYANQELAVRIGNEIIPSSGLMPQCSKELEMLKKHIITDSYSLTMYNILSEPMSYFGLVVFLRDLIEKIFVTNAADLRRKYPQFAGILQMQFRNVFIKSQLIEPAKSVLCVLAGFVVPDLCSYFILNYLKNADLKRLIAAVE